MGYRLKTKHGAKPEVVAGRPNLGLHTKVISWQVEQRGLSGDTPGVYLEVKAHLWDKEKRDLLLSANNWTSTTLKMNVE